MIAKINTENLAIQHEEIKESHKITITQALNNFPNYLFVIGKAKSTAESYRKDVIQFSDFLKSELNNKIRYIDSITKVETELYKKCLIKKMLKGEYKSSTVLRKYNSIKVFFQFLSHEYNIEDVTKDDRFGNKNSLRNWNVDYEVKNLPTIIDDYELEKLFYTIHNSYDKNVYRDLAIIEVLLGTGCRRSELLELKWNDINFYNKEITIRRKKTRNTDTVAVSKQIIIALAKLKEISGDLSSSEHVFRSRQKNSKKLSKSALNAAVKKWVKKANINPSITPHTFRHTFITNCLKSNIPTEKIIKYTGHADANSLKPYTHLVATDTIGVANMLEKIREAI